MRKTALAANGRTDGRDATCAMCATLTWSLVTVTPPSSPKRAGGRVKVARQIEVGAATIQRTVGGRYEWRDAHGIHNLTTYLIPCSPEATSRSISLRLSAQRTVLDAHHTHAVLGDVVESAWRGMWWCMLNVEAAIK